MYLTLLLELFLLSSFTKPINGAAELKSPRRINYGSWGSWELCTPGKNQYVVGMQLKIQSAYSSSYDDVGLSAVIFLCGSVEAPWKIGGKVIHSNRGNSGSWEEAKYCKDGVAVGYQLKVSLAHHRDDSAAENFRLFCCGLTYRTLEGYSDSNYGEWTTVQYCPSGQFLCGIQTQVENGRSRANGYDESGINNVDAKCCEVEYAQLLYPSFETETIVESNNYYGYSAMQHEYKYVVGISKLDSTIFSPRVDKILTAIGASPAISHSRAWQLFKTSLAFAREKRSYPSSWEKINCFTFIRESTQVLKLTVEPGTATTITRRVGKSRLYSFKTPTLTRKDTVCHECRTTNTRKTLTTTTTKRTTTTTPTTITTTTERITTQLPTAVTTAIAVKKDNGNELTSNQTRLMTAIAVIFTLLVVAIFLTFKERKRRRSSTNICIYKPGEGVKFIINPTESVDALMMAENERNQKLMTQK